MACYDTDMPVCATCKQDLPAESFHKRGPGKLQYSCKGCRKVYVKQHYENNKPSYLRRSANQFKKMAAWLYTLKDNQPCADCGVRWPYYVLDYDHLPGSEKEISLARVIEQGWGKTRILKEIAKCELVCANCHRIRTHKRRGEQRL